MSDTPQPEPIEMWGDGIITQRRPWYLRLLRRVRRWMEAL